MTLNTEKYFGTLSRAVQQGQLLCPDPVVLLVEAGTPAVARLAQSLEGPNIPWQHMLAAEARPDEPGAPDAAVFVMPEGVARGLGFRGLLDDFRRLPSTAAVPGQVPVVVLSEGEPTVEGLWPLPRPESN